MTRKFVVVALLGSFVAATGVASAQNADAIKKRQELMKANGAQFRVLTPMLRGEAPYDKAAADRALAVWLKDANDMGALFPANSQTGAETRALPAIWTNAAGFAAEIERFKAAATAAVAATASLDTLRPAVQAVGGSCESCHDKFQKPQ